MKTKKYPQCPYCLIHKKRGVWLYFFSFFIRRNRNVGIRMYCHNCDTFFGVTKTIIYNTACLDVERED